MMPITNTTKPQLNYGITLFLQRWCAMFKKRFLHSCRHKIAIIPQLLLPLIYTMFALIVVDTILKPEDSPPRIFMTALFYDKIAPYAIVGNPNREINDLVKMYTHSASSYTKFVDIDKDSAFRDGNMTKYLLEKAKGRNIGYFNRRYLVAATFTEANKKAIAKAWFNDQAYHAIAVALSAVDNAI
ncbi:ATP-binding cassette sub-family A member 17-like [Xenia sp. Carnegie-2017]|uniref:ATP-binding cassette sub-family A member 17-like n=1 Tax=Xenia sp. Carnegie-2017 TaxID=2897299 RepID=UPI001F033709|nr:ATP-binding cassette sub-family A member 17-like [Xenia sp. Carnegie-2017]